MTGLSPQTSDRVMLYFEKIGQLIKQMFSLLQHKHVVQTFLFCFCMFIGPIGCTICVGYM